MTIGSARQVVERHLRAIASGDAAAIAADYADHAVLKRPDRTHHGRAAILAYFESVPGRLAGRRVEQDIVAAEATTVQVRWSIAGGPHGTDTYQVLNDRIVRQEVVLEDGDF